MPLNRSVQASSIALEEAGQPDYTYDETMEITLAKDVEDFLQEKVRDGVCPDASDLVNDFFRAIRDQQFSPFAVTPELEAWLLEAGDAPAAPLAASDFAGIRERVRSRLDGSAK